MKSSEFKKILKPLIKQTVKEVLFEDGVLSNIVSEVARGLQGNLVVESSNKTNEQALRKKEEEHEKNRQERIRRLNESSKMDIDVFQGTNEIPESSNSGVLRGVSSSDSGVDISDIEKLSNGKWKRLI